MGVDPNIQAVCTQEKEQIKTLNNKFASFIDKVQFLQQQNKMLETTWSLLQPQKTARSNMDNTFESSIDNNPRRQRRLWARRSCSWKQSLATCRRWWRALKTSAAEIANRSRAEAESTYQIKYDELQTQAGKHRDDLRHTKTEIPKMNCNISWLQAEIEGLKGQRAYPEAIIADAEPHGELVVKDANSTLSELEAAL
ncbi:Keratin, type II cytoskeletal 8 [Plecturocebus cupreus]